MGERTLPRPAVQAALVVGLSIAAFVSALGGDFVSDDTVLVAEAGDLRSALSEALWHGSDGSNSWYTIAYRPVVQVAYALERSLFGRDPGPYHGVNLLLHALNALLVWGLLRRRLLTSGSGGEAAARVGEGAALFGAALFAVHPAHAENVAWISGATDLWMLLFWLGSYSLVERGSLSCQLAGALCAALAVLAKEPAVVAPAVLACELWARSEEPLRARLRKLAFNAGGAGIGLSVIGGATLAGSPMGERSSLQLGPFFGLTAEYLRLLLWPAHLSTQVQPFWASGGQVAPGLLATGAMTWLGVVAWWAGARRRRSLRAGLGWIAWITLPLLPPLLLVQGVLSDRFLYAPSVGLCGGLAALLGRLVCRATALRSALVYGVAGAIVCSLLPRSVLSARAYLSNEALWQSQIDAYPAQTKGYDGLGEELAKQARLGEARDRFEQGLSLAIDAKERTQIVHLCLHLLALDVVQLVRDPARAQRVELAYERLLREGRMVCVAHGRGVKLHLSAREQASVRADAPLSLAPYAAVLLTRGDAKASLAVASEALVHQPGLVSAHMARAQALALLGRFDDAVRALSQARVSERGKQVLLGLLERVVSAEQLQRRPAETSEQRAIRDAQVALRLGSAQLARSRLSSALKAAPTDAALVRAHAQTYVSEGRFDQAESVLREAIAQAPDQQGLRRLLEELFDAQREAQAEHASAP